MAFKFTKKTIGLIVLPFVLFALLLYAQSRKPRLLPGVGGDVTAIAFSPDGKNIVCASNNNYVQIWLPEKEKWRSFYNPEVSSNSQPGLCVRLRFSSDGKTLFAGGAPIGGSQVYSQAWDVATRRRKFAFNPTTNSVFDVSPDGRWLAMSYNDTAFLIDLQAKPFQVSQEYYRHSKDTRFFPPRYKLGENVVANSVAFSPDGKMLAVGDNGARFAPTFWSVETGKKLDVTIAAPLAGTPAFLQWSPDGKFLAATNISGITIYDITAQRSHTTTWPTTGSQPMPQTSAPHMGGIIPIAWSPDGKTIFTGGDEVRRWRASDLKLEYSYGVSGPVAVSPDGRTLATASWPDPAGPKGVLLWKLGW
jgi:WD40 repeat protein